MFPLHSRKENWKSSTVPRADNEETVRMSFGTKFKYLRETKGMPRSGVDELFNLMPGTVSNWENGFKEPEEELLPELASFFGVRIKDLIDDAA